MSQALPPRDDFSDIDAIDAAFEHRRRVELGIEEEEKLSPIRAQKLEAEARAKAAILDAQGRRVKMRGLAFLAAGAGIGLALYGASFLLKPTVVQNDILAGPDLYKVPGPKQLHADQSLEWSDENELVTRDNSGSHKGSEELIKPSVVEGSVNPKPQPNSDTSIREQPTTPAIPAVPETSPPLPTLVAPPPAFETQAPTPSIPNEDTSSTSKPIPDAPRSESAAEPYPNREAVSPPTTTRHAPGSLAERLEKEIANAPRLSNATDFTKSEEYKTSEYHGRLRTIKNGELIFRDGKIFTPVRNQFPRTTSEYDGDYAYCRQENENSTTYFCRVLHKGLDESL